MSEHLENARSDPEQNNNPATDGLIVPGGEAVSQQSNLPSQLQTSPLIAASCPVIFEGTVGYFTPPAPESGSQDIAVLVIGAWGIEEMSSRRFMASLCQGLAINGISSLRFDFPGTGDALDTHDFSKGLSVWEDCALQAADLLRTLSNCSRLVIISQSLGSALAARLNARLAPVAAHVFVAPALSGRLFLRELAIWAKTIDNGLELPEDQRDPSPGSIGGHKMPQELVRQIREIAITAMDGQAPENLLIMAPSQRPQDLELAGKLKNSGTDVHHIDFPDYPAMISNMTYARVSMSAVETIVSWVTAVAKPSGSEKQPALPEPDTLALTGQDFTDRPVRFGENSHLSGFLCEPVNGERKGTVLLMTTAQERHASWGRLNVHLARYLAGFGVSSLRFDTSGIADSPPRPGLENDLIYTGHQITDVKEAIDFLAGRSMAPVIAAGRCSGAYLAFQSAIHVQDISRIVCVNPYVFHWKKGDSLEEHLKFVPRNLTAYGPLLFKPETFRRLFNGEINVRAGLLNISRKIFNKGLNAAGKVFPFLISEKNETRIVQNLFSVLQKRDLPFHLLFSENEMGRRDFDRQFGPDGANLKNYPNFALTIIPNADHNLTSPEARAVYYDAVLQAALASQN